MLIITASQLIEGLSACIAMVGTFIIFHNSVKRQYSKRQTLEGVLKAVSLWFMVWLVRKFTINYYHHYLQETHQRDPVYTIPF